MRTTTFVTAALVGALAGNSYSGAPRTAVDDRRVRCANRLSLALTGLPASASLRSSPDPQSRIDELLASAPFVERFARFINSRFNDEPGVTPDADAPYWLARHVLQQSRPWRELFDGGYRVETSGTPATVRVVDDAAGLGYFRSRPWMVRYAGNEEQGYRLNAAFRIQQNVIGLDVTAVTAVPGVDDSAAGRQAAGCRGCHYDSYFALDKVAKILSRRTGSVTDPTFAAPTEGPQSLLDGRMIADDAELVKALVESTDHKFRTCRMAFEYLYGRSESACEAPIFDACVDAYSTTGNIRATLRTIAADAAFCE
jgi:hypothetical protein